MLENKYVRLSDEIKSKWVSNSKLFAKPSVSNGTVLNGPNEWVKQLEAASHQITVMSENFRVRALKRALKVFRNSFKKQGFYSNGSAKWHPLSEYTIKKRAKRGTGTTILYEYGDLYKSIVLEDNKKIYTKEVEKNKSHHKLHTFCYAGYHNEGEGTYGGVSRNGRQPKPYIRRQFIGHSTHLDPFVDKYMGTLLKRYLFDNVFLSKKVV